jgi:hypothetical protein
MRVTIVADDNIVLVDGVPRTVDCSPLVAEGMHAVQWYDTFGEEEFRTEVDAQTYAMTRKPNQTITDFSPYQPYLDQWIAENAKQVLIETERQKAMAENTRRQEALMKLPLAIQEKLIAAQQTQAEQRRLEEWAKLSPQEQQQLIADASS